MEISFDVDVKTYEGNQIGKLKQIVVDPCDQEVSHLIVKKGLLFTKDKVLPMSLVRQVSSDEIILSQQAKNLEDLPDYSEETFFPVKMDAKVAAEPFYSGSVMAFKPGLNAGGTYDEIRFDSRKVTGRYLPQGVENLSIGSPVLTLDQHQVGNLQAIIVDPRTNKISRLSITPRDQQKEQVELPVSWVDEYSRDQIKLLIDRELFSNLPAD